MGQTKTATFATDLSYGSNTNSDNDIDVICSERKSSASSKVMASNGGHKMCDFGMVKRLIVDVDTEDAENNNEHCSDKNVVANGGSVSVANEKVATTQASADSTSSSQTDSEYTYLFGLIKVQAKLKWVNIIGIIVIHSMFLYVFTQSPLKPRIFTYMWGKFRLLFNVFSV